MEDELKGSAKKGKKILFDVGHPAQVHHFKNLYWILERRGWECLFVAKDKDITLQLLDEYRLNYCILSKNRKGILKKIMGIPKDDYLFYRIVKKFRPNIILNRFSIHSGHISKLFRIPNIAFSDTEHASLLHKLTMPFIDVKFTGVSYETELGKNHLRYKASKELFYLHPSIYQPNYDNLSNLGF